MPLYTLLANYVHLTSQESDDVVGQLSHWRILASTLGINSLRSPASISHPMSLHLNVVRYKIKTDSLIPE
jgi:hypothetical protein